MKTLVLIDFQSHYLSEMQEEKKSELIENVKRINKVFMLNNWPIIIVYFGSSYNDNHLIEEMLDILEYKRAILVIKNKCDGSTEILDAIDLNRFPLDIVVGGVFGDECVEHTVNGLAEKDKNIKINVLQDCIWPNNLTIYPDNEDKIEIHHQSELVIV